jgi:hypothetical protein
VIHHVLPFIHMQACPTQPSDGKHGPRPADGLIDEAVEAGALEAVPPDPVLRFSHPLLREAADAMLSGQARRRLHGVIGAAVEDPIRRRGSWPAAPRSWMRRWQAGSRRPPSTRPPVERPPAPRRWPGRRPS